MAERSQFSDFTFFTHVYEILAPLGAGGMGEVYRARDTRLERTVAIKILPQQLASDPVRKQRFEREAKTVSNLNHPHICVLHDVGHQDGIDYLVRECVEGETLAKRLEKGPLPLEQVLKLGPQIADALDKAHRSGVVHRDLKPGNIMLTPTGAKLFDFGLAKPASPPASAATLTAATQSSPVTEQGTIVGTYPYMSPEQIEDKELDGRSDIFSLGAVLYEMITGRRAFEGKSQLSVASAILGKDPAPIRTIKPLTPPALDHAIRRCLAKDPEERWQTARDLALELKWMAEPGSHVADAGKTRMADTGPLIWGLCGLLLGALLLAGSVGFFYGKSRAAPVVRFNVVLPPEGTVDVESPPQFALSPDGSKLAFFSINAAGNYKLYLRSLAAYEAKPLDTARDEMNPFFSPDGDWLGLYAPNDARLEKLAISGGLPQLLCNAGSRTTANWPEGGNIIFAQAGPRAVSSPCRRRHSGSDRRPFGSK
jgi:hypothetical protein